MYHRAKKHFKRADPHPYEAALGIDIEEITPSKNLFRDIVWTIVGQQLSARAADAIFARFLTLFPDCAVRPPLVLQISDEAMRGCGLSSAKGRAIKAFAEAVEREEILLETLFDLPDQAVIEQLTNVK